MKKSGFLLIYIFCICLGTHAQTFTQHLQQSTWKGKVTVKQSKEITELVDGTARVSATAATNAQTKQKDSTQKPIAQKETVQKETVQKESAQKETIQKENTHKETAHKETAHKETAQKESTQKVARTDTQKTADDNEMDIPTVDMRKKVMRGSHKITGYRVQAYAGGNKRTDKQQAQQIGDAIKMRYPDQPVYVHFYSPRWICRIGNYRSYEEAAKMLKAVKAMGYKSATIVKGKITVFD